ncbi:phage holin [Gemmiger sp. An87]|nr:phage holin [Gemmiger sp. An87]
MIKAINWKVRIGNKTFWLTIVPALALLVQVVAAVFGITIDLTDTVAKLVDVINAVFAVLVIVGVVVDPTTAGVSDSAQAMTYTAPRAKEE